MKTEKHEHRATIETIINTAAIASMTLGVTELNEEVIKGFVLICFAVALEFFKYWGRKDNYW